MRESKYKENCSHPSPSEKAGTVWNAHILDHLSDIFEEHAPQLRRKFECAVVKFIDGF